MLEWVHRLMECTRATFSDRLPGEFLELVSGKLNQTTILFSVLHWSIWLQSLCEGIP